MHFKFVARARIQSNDSYQKQKILTFSLKFGLAYAMNYGRFVSRIFDLSLFSTDLDLIRDSIPLLTFLRSVTFQTKNKLLHELISSHGQSKFCTLLSKFYKFYLKTHVLILLIANLTSPLCPWFMDSLE